LATVGGVFEHDSSGVATTISGGVFNIASAERSTIGGGGNNRADGDLSTIGGGFGNTASGIYSTVGGGRSNTASGNYSTIGGGRNNLARSNNSTVHGISNIAGGLARRANNITGATNTITVLDAVTSNFSTTSNAISIRYFNNSNSTWNVVTRTASNITQSGGNVTFTVASIGATGQTWSNVTVIDTTLSDTTNGQIVNGTGSIAIGTSSTVSGGNNNVARGTSSTVCGGQSNTASGNRSTIGGGQSNTASGNYSKIGGGRGNTASGYDSTVGGGQGNTVSGSYSTVSGGYRNTSGYSSFVGGGVYNEASGGYNVVCGGGGFYNGNQANGDRNCIVGGSLNLISGSRNFIGGGGTAYTFGFNSDIKGNIIYGWGSVICGGGGNNTANFSNGYYNSICGGQYSTIGTATNGTFSCSILGGSNNKINGNLYFSTIGGGLDNIISSSECCILGGSNNKTTNALSTIIGGDRAKTTKYGEVAHASGGFSNQIGTAQHSILIARNVTNTNNTVTLFLNGSDQRLILPLSTTWTFEIKVSAYNTSDNIGAWWIIRGGIRKNHQGTTTLIGNLVTESGVDGTWTNAAVAVTAFFNTDEDGSLNINVTGLTNKTIRWTALVDICQTAAQSVADFDSGE